MATRVILPKLEMAQETATIVEWLKHEGDHVRKGEPLLVVETDKVTFELESPAAGVLSRVSAGPGQELPVAQVIAYLLEPGERLPPDIAPDDRKEQEGAGPGAEGISATPVAHRIAADHGLDLSGIVGTGPRGQITKADVERSTTALSRSLGETPHGRLRATPAARRIARERGLDLSNVKGSGPGGQVQAVDLAEQASLAELGRPAVGQIVPLHGMRRTIAERMTRSFTSAPHISLSARVDMAALEADRAHLNEADGEPHVSISVLLVKIVAAALKRHPWLNSSLQGQEIHLFSDINVGVAVDVEEGLVVPVVRHADRKGIAQIASELIGLVGRARNGKLTPQDVVGGTFTLTNLGPFGVGQFTAIINPPQAAILAVGAIQSEVVPDEAGQITVRPIAQITLSADHRVVDGTTAARFLADVKSALEHPSVDSSGSPRT